MAAGLEPILVDAHLLAVAKPPGRLVIPGRGAPEPTLQEELQVEHGRLWVVHRLDRGTSGVLLFARTAAAHRALNQAFEGREVEKRYLALVRGLPPPAWRSDAPLAAGRKGRMKAVAPGDPRGKPSATRFRTLEPLPARAGSGLPDLALVEASPETGRTHQIRVHLAASGFPLAVDPAYGEATPLRTAAGEEVLSRTPLHAAALSLKHPATGARLYLEAPLPPDLTRALEAARGG
ncbi:MAG TPA: RluA family pseudouridine synthase [Anaeromyxobacteraceae bacterium]|nr:RluA family pseudouridine synthase [Anaeromyxobacteraceae bacterium]